MVRLTIADLNTIQITLNHDPSRCQGVRYALTKSLTATETLIFHDIYSQVLPLAASNKKEDLDTLKAFILKLEEVEGQGRAYYQERSQKSCLYKLLTKLHRLVSKVMGKTPREGTHQDRLNALKRKVDQKLTNLEAGYHVELYATLKPIIEKSNIGETFYINEKLLPDSSREERSIVLHMFMDEDIINGFSDYCEYDGYEKYEFIGHIVIFPNKAAYQKWSDENPR